MQTVGQPGAPLREQRFLFYTLVSSSFIESAIETYVENLSLLFAGDAEVKDWLRDEWLAEEAQHGEITRELVRRIWPEYDWDAAYQEFWRRIPHQTTAHLQSSCALEALSRCATETYTAMMYRCMASYAGDAALRRTLESMSSDEVRHFGAFRRIFHRYDAAEQHGAWTKLRTVLGRTEKLRGNDLGDLFDIMNAFWTGAPPFALQTFAQFRTSARPVVLRHFPIEETQRMLFAPLGLRGGWERLARWAVGAFLVWRNLGGRSEPAAS